MSDVVQPSPIPDTAAMVNSPAPPENQGVPEASVPSNVQQSANVTTQPPQQIDTIPSAPLTQKVQDPNGGLFERVLQTIAGNPSQPGAHYDTATGQYVATPVTSKPSLAAHIVAAAVTGMLRGMGAPPGPGHVGEAGAIALQGGIADQQRLRENMQQDYERQTQAQVQKYQVAHLNAQTALDSANAEAAGMGTLERAKAMNDDAVMQLTAGGNIETDPNGNPVTLTKSDILAKVKSGELNAGDTIGMLYGGTLIDDKPNALYVVNKDPNAPVKISQDQFDRWKAAGVSVPPEVVGQSIPAKSFSAYTNQAMVLGTGEAALTTLRHDAGDNKALLAKLPTNIDPDTPGLGTSLRLLQQALRGNKGNIYDAVESVYQKNPQSGNILMNAFGGKDTIADISNEHTSTLKANQASAEEDARQKALLPYKEKDQQFQRDLQTSAQIAQKELSDNLETNKDARDKVTTDVVKPYLDKMSDINMTNAALAQAQSNPVAARAVIFKLVGVSQPTGSHRVMPAEIDAFRYPGGVPQKSVEAFKNFLLGEPWTEGATNAAKAFVQGQQAAAEVNLKHGVNVVNGTYNTHINAGNIIGAGYTTPTPDQIVRTGTVNGQAVYQLKDGSTVDYAGRPVQ